MPAAGTTPRSTAQAELDAAIARLGEGARVWARAALPDRIALARGMLRGAARVSPRLVEAACLAKEIPLDGPAAGTEWLTGPVAILRALRRTVRALVKLSRNGNTPLRRLGETGDGRLTVRVFPATRLDAALLPGVRGDAHLEAGLGEDALGAARARFHHTPDHDGRVALVVGDPATSGVGPGLLTTALFNEGKACLLLLPPTSAWLGPLLEEAFAEPIARGFLAVVYGGDAEADALARHPGVDEARWPPGGIVPVLVVPGGWEAGALGHQAANVAGMLAHDGGADAAAPQVLVTPRGWSRRDAFLAALEHHLALAPARRAFLPGAEERHARLTSGRASMRRTGGGDGAPPWTVVTGLDPSDADEPFFTAEARCAALGETALGSEDPAGFLEAAVAFANERLGGGLCAHVLVHPRALAERGVHEALERAIRDLHHGVVVVNGWAGQAFAMGAVPWGVHARAAGAGPGARALVHDTLMLERVEKAVVRFPSFTWPKPIHFPSHRTAHVVGRRLAELEAGRRWLALPSVLAAAAQG